MTASRDRVLVDFDVPSRMRDGIRLRANVYRPEGPGPWPTLLTRTPYGKDALETISWPGLDPVQAARGGFMVVVQDVRGRFASEGEWHPFQFEGQDGYDSVEWAASLPGSTGQVGMYGGSYHGNTQWLAAIEAPPSLAAISPAMTWSEPMDGVFARGGAVELGLGLMWALNTGYDQLGRFGIGDAELQRDVDALVDEWDRLGSEGYWELPVDDMAVLRRHGVRDIGALTALRSPDVPDWCRVAGRHERVDVPSFHMAGWYDVFLQGTLDNYLAMIGLGRDARLIIGPWSHRTFADPVGEQVFGMRSNRDGDLVDAQGGWSDLQLAWFRHHLVPESDVELPDAPVRIFVMGRNEWRDEPCWPPERVEIKRWFLRSGGALTTASPEPGEQVSVYEYDPAQPVPTVGGHGVMWPGVAPGPVDQAAVEARDDVLVFTSDPLRHDLEVSGRVRVVLHAESSAMSTDWVARLCDVHPDGRSVNLCDGIVRVIDGAQRCALHEIDLWATSNVFLRGHRLRVHVTSSSFPRWDRNLNTGDQHQARYDVARQRVHHDAQRSSYLELPIHAR